MTASNDVSGSSREERNIEKRKLERPPLPLQPLLMRRRR
jgi:hypothetical protein